MNKIDNKNCQTKSWWMTDEVSTVHVETGVCSSTNRFICVHCTKIYNREN